MQSKRFKHITNLSIDYYEPGIPVEIDKGAIVLDQKTNELLLQLKLRNLSNKMISGVEVWVECFDLEGKGVAEEHVVIYRYQNLEVKPKALFGDREAIKLISNQTKRINVIFKKIAFVDSGLLDFLQPQKLPIPTRKEIRLLDQGVQKEIEALLLPMHLNAVTYLPELVDEDLWICCCGRVNEKEDRCIRCDRSKVNQFEQLDLEKLEKQAQEKKRLLQEEELQKRKQETLIKTKALNKIKRRKKMIAMIMVASLSGMGIISISYVLESTYYNAIQAYLEHDYAQAYQSLNKVRFYKNSSKLMNNLYEEEFMGDTLPIQIGDKWGFINETGKLILDPFYEDVAKIIDGAYNVKIGGKVGLLDDNLNYTIRPLYDAIEPMANDLYKLTLDGKIGVWNNHFEPMTELIYDEIEEMQLTIKNESLKEETNEHLRLMESAEYYLESVYVVELDDHIGLLDKDLQSVIEPIYDKIEVIGDNHLEVRQNGKRGIVNAEGQTLVQPIYSHIELINENFYIGTNGSRMSIISKEGKIIHEGERTDYIGIENFIALESAEGWRILDMDGERAINTLFESVSYDGCGKVLVEYNTPFTEDIEAEPFYVVGKYNEEDKALPTNHYILFIEKEGIFYRADNNEIVLRNMVYKFEYERLPSEWKELIDTNEIV